MLESSFHEDARAELDEAAADHTPRHVHVYRDGVLVLKWDLDGWTRMTGHPNGRIVRLLQDLREEGLL